MHKRYFGVTHYFVWQASSLNMAFVFQKVVDFEEREDRSFECLGFEDCQPTMPPKPSTPISSRGNRRGRHECGQQHRIEREVKGGKWECGYSHRGKRKVQSLETADDGEDKKYENNTS